MVCPSCGHETESKRDTCSCGARWVGPPPTDSVSPVPRLFYGLVAAFLVAVGVVFQVAVTGRSLYLTRSRWPWELLVTTVYLAKFIAPVALVAGTVAWRGLRLAKARPTEYGGLGWCRTALTLSVLLVFGNMAAFIVRIPDLLEHRRVKRVAYTQVKMYQLNGAITRYREQFGFYPRRLIDLQEMDPKLGPILDYWEHEFVYEPMSAAIASRVAPVPFQNYWLVSRGADGVLGTADDVTMIDGMVIDASSAQKQQLAQPPPPKPKPRTARSRRPQPKAQSH